MEWRIVESSRGYYAQFGGRIDQETEVGYAPGFVMPCFHVSESARFDTKREAEKYIERRKKEGRS